MFDWITGLMQQSGYLGVLLLMVAENVFPPIPSELVMPLAGFIAARGELNILLVVAAGTAGSLLGALPWYYAGKWLGAGRLKGWAGRHGRWLTVAPGEVDAAVDWFRRHGGRAVLLGRLVPTVRTLISVPAGLTGMGLGPFLAYSAVGTLLWTGLLAGTGYLLEGQYEKVAEYLNPFSNVVLGLILLAYFYRVATFRGRQSG